MWLPIELDLKARSTGEFQSGQAEVFVVGRVGGSSRKAAGALSWFTETIQEPSAASTAEAGQDGECLFGGGANTPEERAIRDQCPQPRA